MSFFKYTLWFALCFLLGLVSLRILSLLFFLPLALFCGVYKTHAPVSVVSALLSAWLYTVITKMQLNIQVLGTNTAAPKRRSSSRRATL